MVTGSRVIGLGGILFMVFLTVALSNPLCAAEDECSAATHESIDGDGLMQKQTALMNSEKRSGKGSRSGKGGSGDGGAGGDGGSEESHFCMTSHEQCWQETGSHPYTLHFMCGLEMVDNEIVGVIRSGSCAAEGFSSHIDLWDPVTVGGQQLDHQFGLHFSIWERGDGSVGVSLLEGQQRRWSIRNPFMHALKIGSYSNVGTCIQSVGVTWFRLAFMAGLSSKEVEHYWSCPAWYYTCVDDVLKNQSILTQNGLGAYLLRYSVGFGISFYLGTCPSGECPLEEGYHQCADSLLERAEDDDALNAPKATMSMLGGENVSCEEDGPEFNRCVKPWVDAGGCEGGNVAIDASNCSSECIEEAEATCEWMRSEKCDFCVDEWAEDGGCEDSTIVPVNVNCSLSCLFEVEAECDDGDFEA